MCGIAGEIGFTSESPGDAWVRCACDIMKHRGPDGTGYFCESQVAFGHRRLSIIDVDGGIQPMSYNNNRLWITYNGEIYNYPELKQQLTQLGCEFQTTSDTEVILAAYATWGVDAIARLDGIFAFGLWDAETHTLVLARDHLGIKPLLYQIDETGLRFSSELKALLAHPKLRASVNAQALHDYLALGYVLSPNTIINGIQKLPAGHYLIVRDGNVSLNSYWDLAQYVRQNTADPYSVQEMERRLSATVEQQMISDVPLGTFLSGGLDSSTISYYASKATPNLKTFSLGFAEASYNELDYARLVGNHLHSDHRDSIAHAPTLNEISSMVWHYDEPLGDTSIIPTYFLSRLAKQHVKVALSGDGADELMGGYDTHLADKFQRMYKRVPGWLHHNILRPLAGAIPSSYRKVSLDFKIKQFVDRAWTSPERAHFGWRGMFTPGEIGMLTGVDPRETEHTFDHYATHFKAVSGGDWLNQMLYVDMKTWLVDDILTKVDRASMAASLEVRVPFLAHPLVEYVMSLPQELKLRGTTGKYMLRQLMANRLPETTLKRQKRGFNSPVANWMRDLWAPEIDTIFAQNDSTCVDLSTPAVQTIWEQHRTGQVDHGFKLWTLLSLLLWEKSVLNSSVAVL